MATTILLQMVLMAALIYCIYLPETRGTKFEIENQCGYTVWPAWATQVVGRDGGGQELRPGQSWTVNMPKSATTGRFWGRTNCNFDQKGRGSCQTGDCSGLLACDGIGNTPATLVEYTLNGYQNMDFYDISLVNGFNIPLSLAPTNVTCTKIDCKIDINAICPRELKVEGGCKNACQAFKSDAFCCTGNYSGNNCDKTLYADVFKKQCPQAYVYSLDNANTNYVCPYGTDYKIVFCPTLIRPFVLLLTIEY